ncbi:MAG: TonB-dependent receptor [Aquabacterium sp.]
MKLKQYLFSLPLAFGLGHLAWHNTAHAQTSDLSVDPSDTAYPVVITPTRLRQSLADVPASVTVITGETLRRYGINRIEEAFRMVPGFVVTQTAGSNYKINYHGTTTASPRRINVLIDGVSAYQIAFSKVEWSWLPVALEDIDRIEVTRGPDSASYGPNSMTAVVDILTKHPKDVEPAMVAVTVGSHKTLDTTLRLATTLGSTSLKLTANTHDDSGFDSANSGAPIGPATQAAHLRFSDSTQVSRLQLSGHQELAGGATLDVRASHVSAKLTATQTDFNQITGADPDGATDQLSSRWIKPLSAQQELQVDVSFVKSRLLQSWTSCWPTIAFSPTLAALFRDSPTFKSAIGKAVTEYVATGRTSQTLTDVISQLSAYDQQVIGQLVTALLAPGAALQALQPDCGSTTNSIVESRSQIELQDTYVLSDQLRVVGGMGFRQQSGDSQTQLGGSVSNQVRWLFGHAEYRPTNWLTANVGGYGEYNSLSGRTFSPRVALNTRLSDNQSVRAVFSKGTRSPDLFEERANWSYTYTGLTYPIDGSTSARIFPTQRSPGNLDSEEIWSRELGYLLTLRPAGLTFDAKVFDDRLKNLISQRLSLVDFSPTNNDSVRLTGAEMQAQWDMSRTWSGWLSYSHLLNLDATDPQEMAQYARDSGAAGVSVVLSDTWRASLAHYAASGNGLVEFGYARTDLTLTHTFALAQQTGSLSLTIGYLQTPQTRSYIGVGNASYVSAYYDSRFNIFGQARIAF